MCVSYGGGRTMSTTRKCDFLKIVIFLFLSFKCASEPSNCAIHASTTRCWCLIKCNCSVVYCCCRCHLHKCHVISSILTYIARAHTHPVTLSRIHSFLQYICICIHHNVVTVSTHDSMKRRKKIETNGVCGEEGAKKMEWHKHRAWEWMRGGERGMKQKIKPPH